MLKKHIPVVITVCGIIAYLFSSLLSSGYAQALYTFKIGDHQVEGTTLRFEFPDETMKTLYVFNFAEWNGLDKETNQAIIRLYDIKKNLLDEGKSVCINTKYGKSFGSIAFSKTNRANVGKVAYFKLIASPCTEGKNILKLKDNPELQPLSEDVSMIGKILFQCLATGKSEQDCVCIHKRELDDPIKKADAFLMKHPELKGKEISFFESESSSKDKGIEKVSISMPLDELPGLRSYLQKCK